MNSKNWTYKGLMVVSLVLFATSVFLPWLAENRVSSRGGFSITKSHFWSYQTIARTTSLFYYTGPVNILILRFQEYWLPSAVYAYPPDIYYGWFFVFVFQIIGIVTGAVSIFKEKVKSKPLPQILTITCLVSSLILCGFQLLRQPAAANNYLGSLLETHFDIGFYLAVSSTILWTVTFWIEKLLKREMRFIILLLITTAIPSGYLIIGLVEILHFYIQMGRGYFWFDWDKQLIGVTTGGAGAAIYIPQFVVGLVCIPLFFASILFLYKELQSRKQKRRALSGVETKP